MSFCQSMMRMRWTDQRFDILSGRSEASGRRLGLILALRPEGPVESTLDSTVGCATCPRSTFGPCTRTPYPDKDAAGCRYDRDRTSDRLGNRPRQRESIFSCGAFRALRWRKPDRLATANPSSLARKEVRSSISDGTVVIAGLHGAGAERDPRTLGDNACAAPSRDRGSIRLARTGWLDHVARWLGRMSPRLDR